MAYRRKNQMPKSSTFVFDSPSSSPRGHGSPLASHARSASIFSTTYQSSEGINRTESPRLRRGVEAISSSLNHFSEINGNAFEEGRTANGSFESFGQLGHQPISKTIEADQETQLKASRDVAIAMAAKAKLFLRELKTVKADLAFVKQRCTQLEEVNKILRESCEKGDNADDDDLVRLQLETLLAEKARLAHENSMYARENRFLREIVDYHQLTMQDIVYVDEGHEEIAEVYPSSIQSVHIDVNAVIATTKRDQEVTSAASYPANPSSLEAANVSSPSATQEIVSPVKCVQSPMI